MKTPSPLMSLLVCFGLFALSPCATAKTELPENLVTYFAASELTGNLEETTYQIVLECNSGTSIFEKREASCSLTLLTYEICKQSSTGTAMNVYSASYFTDRDTLKFESVGPAEIKLQFGEEKIFDRRFELVIRFKNGLELVKKEPMPNYISGFNGTVTSQSISADNGSILKRTTTTTRLKLVQKNAKLKRGCPIELLVAQ